MASTFPAGIEDATPRFVEDLVIAMKEQRPGARMMVLAPQVRGRIPAHRAHAAYEEVRFSYAWPPTTQRLTEQGILPALRAAPWLVPLIPSLFIGMHVAAARLIREWKPDVLHAHWFTPQGIVAARLSERTGVPLLLTTHASDVSIWATVPHLGPRLVRRWFPQARRITAVSHATLARARGFFAEPEWAELEARISVAPMGVRLPPTTAPRHSVSSERGASEVVLFLGRFAEKKGIPVLIDACARLARPTLRLVLAGDGPARATIERAVRESGIADQVHFPGFVSGEAKDALLAEAAVLVVPSIVTPGGDAEGLPVSLMEGLAAGVPVVATDATNAGELIADGVSGRIVPSQDPAALAAAIAQALDARPADRDAMSRAGRQCVERLAWPQVAHRYWKEIDACTS